MVSEAKNTPYQLTPDAAVPPFVPDTAGPDTATEEAHAPLDAPTDAPVETAPPAAEPPAEEPAPKPQIIDVADPPPPDQIPAEPGALSLVFRPGAAVGPDAGPALDALVARVGALHDKIARGGTRLG